LNKLGVAILGCAALLIPSWVAAQPIAYVTNQSTNVVHMLRTTDWLNIGNIPVGNSPAYCAGALAESSHPRDVR